MGIASHSWCREKVGTGWAPISGLIEGPERRLYMADQWLFRVPPFAGVFVTQAKLVTPKTSRVKVDPIAKQTLKTANPIMSPLSLLYISPPPPPSPHLQPVFDAGSSMPRQLETETSRDRQDLTFTCRGR